MSNTVGLRSLLSVPSFDSPACGCVRSGIGVDLASDISEIRCCLIMIRRTIRFTCWMSLRFFWNLELT